MLKAELEADEGGRRDERDECERCCSSSDSGECARLTEPVSDRHDERRRSSVRGRIIICFAGCVRQRLDSMAVTWSLQRHLVSMFCIFCIYLVCV